MSHVTRCQGRTLKGGRCGHYGNDKYCWQHGGVQQLLRCKSKNTSGVKRCWKWSEDKDQRKDYQCDLQNLNNPQGGDYPGGFYKCHTPKFNNYQCDSLSAVPDLINYGCSNYLREKLDQFPTCQPEELIKKYKTNFNFFYKIFVIFNIDMLTKYNWRSGKFKAFHYQEPNGFVDPELYLPPKTYTGSPKKEHLTLLTAIIPSKRRKREDIENKLSAHLETLYDSFSREYKDQELRLSADHISDIGVQNIVSIFFDNADWYTYLVKEALRIIKVGLGDVTDLCNLYQGDIIPHISIGKVAKGKRAKRWELNDEYDLVIPKGEMSKYPFSPVNKGSNLFQIQVFTQRINENKENKGTYQFGKLEKQTPKRTIT